MNIYEEAASHLNETVTKAFIEAVLKEVEHEIEYLERTYTLRLADREDFNNARMDWKHMTYGQVMYIASAWRSQMTKNCSLYDRTAI